MKRSILSRFRLPAALTALAFLFACNLGLTEGDEKTFSFPSLPDSLAGADHAVITLKDTTGRMIDTLFDGPVHGGTRFNKLKTEEYDGGLVVISILGTKGGLVIYEEDRRFDGNKEDVVTIISHVHPSTSVKIQASGSLLTLALDDSLPLPAANVLPAHLADKSLRWESRRPDIFLVTSNHLLAQAQGSAYLVASLVSDTVRKDSVLVEVVPKGSLVTSLDSLRLYPDTLPLALRGLAGRFTVTAYPAMASSEVTWKSLDPSVVNVDEDGNVTALSEGIARVVATSKIDAAISKTARVKVIPSVKVDSVRLKQDSLNLFVKGESLSLTASIFPSTLQSLFVWRSTNTEVAMVDASGKVSPVSAGKAYVLVQAQADSTRKDSALILVKRDIPRIQVGDDTIVAVGTSVTHRPVVTQDYGQVVLFRWDLDGDGAYEDSSVTVPDSLSHVYGEAKEYPVRFFGRDTEGNETIHTRKVKAVQGRVVQISDPKDGAQVNITPITVTWIVDGALPQTSSQALSPGENVITRSAQDSAGNSYSHSIKITLDQTAPNRPTVKGPTTPINILAPTWTWVSGGGGNGTFRYRIDNSDLSTAPTTADTFHTTTDRLADGTHTLYVQERDQVGNWSASGSFAVRIDTTKPAAPTVSLTQSSPTKERSPTWSWAQSESGPGIFRFSLDNAAFRDTGSTSFRPSVNLVDGTHTIRVQERDSAGNWSDAGSSSITIDATPPNAPVFNATPRSPVGSLRPIWKWSSGGNGGSGQFRYKLDNGAYSAWSLATSYQPPTLSEGPHTLYVQERDALENESEESTRKLVFVARGLMGTVRVYDDALRSISTATSASGILHMATHQGTESKVYYYTAGTWSVLGNTPFATQANTASLAFSKDTAFALYQEETTEGRNVLRMKKFAQGSWMPVGTSWIDSGFYMLGISMAIGPEGTPYVCWIANIEDVKVARLNRAQNKWELVGDPVGASTDNGGYTSIAINASNEVHVAYTDYRGDSFGKPTIKRWTGSTWTQVARYPESGSYLSLVFHGNIPFFGFSSILGVHLIQYSPGFTPIEEYSLAGDESSLGVSSDGVPYLAFKDSWEKSVHLVTPIDGKLVDLGSPMGTSILGSGGLNVTVTPSGIPQVGLIDPLFDQSGVVYQFGFDP